MDTEKIVFNPSKNYELEKDVVFNIPADSFVVLFNIIKKGALESEGNSASEKVSLFLYFQDLLKSVVEEGKAKIVED